MDTKKKIIHELVALCLAISAVLPVFGQNVKRIKFCDKNTNMAWVRIHLRYISMY